MLSTYSHCIVYLLNCLKVCILSFYSADCADWQEQGNCAMELIECFGLMKLSSLHPFPHQWKWIIYGHAISIATCGEALECHPDIICPYNESAFQP